MSSTAATRWSCRSWWRRGEAGTTTLAESVAALPAERYRVEKYLVADPADVDGDCIDDLTELADPVRLNPVNPAAELPLSDGAITIPDLEAFEYLAAGRFPPDGRFVLFDLDTAWPGVYVVNTRTHPTLASFLEAVGLDPDDEGVLTGEISYDPDLLAPDGRAGVYWYGLRDVVAFHDTLRVYTVLAASLPLLADNLAYYLPGYQLPQVEAELPLLRQSRLDLVFDEDLAPEDRWSLDAPPGRPTGLTGAVSHAAVSLRWEAPHDASITGYQILRLNRAVDAAEAFSVHVDDTGSAASSYVDRAVEPGSRYGYRVKARNAAGLSPWSQRFDADTPAASLPPPPPPPLPLARPTGLTGSVSHAAVSLHWDDPHDASITGYHVLRGPNGDSLTPRVDDTGSASTSYTDTRVKPETAYVYSVKALKSGGRPSEASESVSVLTLSCPGADSAPTPVEVAVTAVPIVVASTTADYFVLYVRHEQDADTTVEIPVLVARGEAGTTTLSENVKALPPERYKVEKYLVADPADVDGDCIDDLTELADLGTMNPVNSAPALDISDGAVAIPGHDIFETLSRDYGDKSRVKFVLLGMDTDRPGIYFMNTEKYSAHQFFLDAFELELGQDRVIPGEIVYDPELVASDGSLGAYYYSLTHYWLLQRPSSNRHSVVARSYTLLAASMPVLEDNLAYYMPGSMLFYLQSALPLLRASRIPLVFDADLYGDTTFLALNPGVGYGRLQVLEPDERPHPRDIALYEALPNELPRVAGIISTVPQTPLSHVNLRAVQDGIPNAFIRDVPPDIAPLIGDYVRYEVTDSGWGLRTATPAEVEAHYEASRPAQTQTPERDLSVEEITPLSEIGFEDWDAFGVKAANVAVLGTLGFPAGTVPEGGTVPIGGTVPDGFAIPFYFYDEFMQTHGFYDDVEAMLADEDFQTDFEVQDDMLDDLRDAIKDADTPHWIIAALETMHAAYPDGQSLRYRSSTNNEDLPGFNGAGLYDSKTQDPEETEEDGIDKSLKGVFASLWTFRAFTEREFHRIDHLAAAMGVLVHPNYTGELANGVAVSFDPFRGQAERYYVNTQVGEDLVTNPEAHSVPEEILLYKAGDWYLVLSTSNLVPPGQLLMSDAQVEQLRDHLTVIHDHFKGLYSPAAGEPFAMEIEFKITSENILAIKQARPWVFGDAE